jgi:5'-nucleotidase
VVVKSGCDFRNVSYIKVKAGEHLSQEELEKVPTVPIDDSNVKTDQEYFYMTKDIVRSIEPNQEIKDQIENYYQELDKELKIVNCFLDAELDTKFSSIRTKETPIGNFLADLMLREHNCDCAFLNGGNVRADQVYDAGKFTVGDWNDLLPFCVPVVKIEISGV